MAVSKSRDGVPGWDGDPTTAEEFREATYLYEATQEPRKRSLVPERVSAELTAAAKDSLKLAGPEERQRWKQNNGIVQFVTFLIAGLIVRHV